MSDLDFESVQNFIRHRYEEVLRNEAESQAQQAMRPITIRMPEGWISLVDLLAHELDMNRQEFMSQLISESLQEAIVAMTGFAPRDQQQEVYSHYLDVMTGKELSGKEASDE